jgi:membrane-associated phospholipid phosphatase
VSAARVPSTGMTDRPRQSLLLGAATCALAAAATGVLALLVAATERADLRLSLQFTRLDGTRAAPLLDALAHLADPVPYAVAGLALTAIAWRRGSRRLAFAIPPLFLASGLTAEVLKELTASARWFDAPLWPSGHATGAMTIALCAVLVSPPRLRPLVAVAGAAFTLAVACAIVALSWHFASDVIAGYLIATGVVLAALAAATDAG